MKPYLRQIKNGKLGKEIMHRIEKNWPTIHTKNREEKEN